MPSSSVGSLDSASSSNHSSTIHQFFVEPPILLLPCQQRGLATGSDYASIQALTFLDQLYETCPFRAVSAFEFHNAQNHRKAVAVLHVGHGVRELEEDRPNREFPALRQELFDAI